ncbi:MAG: saccharopine dehydrogenase NADP-binding domain-containing protein [Fidelibacterota bacterium]|nr:MAG: saccharopine dehydrogenase NADP-binding domain-containing protein [Candidatus Neomarinimicrobiota bacterium]
MIAKSILILGGYGNAGLAIARLCLEYTDARLTLAGRSQSKAVEAAAQLNAQYEGFRVAGLQADASKEEDLKRALVGVDLLVVASSTSPYVQQIASATLESGVDYLDIQFSTAKVKVLQSRADEIKEAGRCFITDGGFHPGIPAALVRYAGDNIPNLERAMVGAVLKIDWGAYDIGASTAEEFVTEFRDYQAEVFRKGRWKKASMLRMKNFPKIDFGEPFGRVPTAPMMLEEMRCLPDMIPTLRDTAFYVAGFNWLVDWVLFPAGILAMRLGPKVAHRAVGDAVFWGWKKFTKPPYGIVLQLQARGTEHDRSKVLRVRLAHQDGYFLTAAPTVACIRQYLEGVAMRPGLHFMAHIVDPALMLKDIESMGVEVAIKEDTSL